MKSFLHLLFLCFCVVIIQSSIYTDIKSNVLSFLHRAIDENEENKIINRPKFHHDGEKRYFNTEHKSKDIRMAKDKMKLLKKMKNRDTDMNANDKNDEVDILQSREKKIAKENYLIDPILNYFKRRSSKDFRRKDTESSIQSSSSLELQSWKDEWRQLWIQKKFEAVNSSVPYGESVHMVAARPWGVPCGDPNQHDMPWGTCMLAVECEAEFRIYRGDYFCGRTQFICCAIQHSSYDMFQGFDLSFADSGLSTDSEEKKNRGKGSKERRRQRRRRERRKRKNERLKRKRNIKRNIKKIIKEIRKILSRTYRNGTSERKRKTKQLKSFIKELKKQYRQDRKAVKDIHETELIKIDANLMHKLNQIRDLNKNFIRNATFRDIVVNGTVSKQGARMLVEAYPELISYFETRRSGRADKREDYLEYDIEYGMMYYN